MRREQVRLLRQLHGRLPHPRPRADRRGALRTVRAAQEGLQRAHLLWLHHLRARALPVAGRRRHPRHAAGDSHRSSQVPRAERARLAGGAGGVEGRLLALPLRSRRPAASGRTGDAKHQPADGADEARVGGALHPAAAGNPSLDPSACRRGEQPHVCLAWDGRAHAPQPHAGGLWDDVFLCVHACVQGVGEPPAANDSEAHAGRE
mmetsp:Transcript_44788/g.111524  ORF Transcript_44788/g.111524 Transcript_44788/m.111524 type:complete len:205 (-) Transcript_44788:835-1449(-)